MREVIDAKGRAERAAEPLISRFTILLLSGTLFAFAGFGQLEGMNAMLAVAAGLIGVAGHRLLGKVATVQANVAQARKRRRTQAVLERRLQKHLNRPHLFGHQRADWTSDSIHNVPGVWVPVR
jgi:hypothetical protein